MTALDLPLEVQARLLDFSEYLPESKQADFARRVSDRVGHLIKDHPRTLIFSALGGVLGEVLDNLLTFSLPFSEAVVCLTADRASEMIGAGAGISGFIRDRKAVGHRELLRRFVREEVQDIVNSETGAWV